MKISRYTVVLEHLTRYLFEGGNSSPPRPWPVTSWWPSWRRSPWMPSAPPSAPWRSSLDQSPSRCWSLQGRFATQIWHLCPVCADIEIIKNTCTCYPSRLWPAIQLSTSWSSHLLLYYALPTRLPATLLVQLIPDFPQGYMYMDMYASLDCHTFCCR